MSRGVTVKSPERVAEAVRLRAEGYLVREIAVRLDVGRTTIDAWLMDPDGSRLAARKRRYAGTCVDCGGPTDGSNGWAAAPTRCSPCAHRYEREAAVWTRERLIAEACRWRDLTGEWPVSTDWHTTVGNERTSDLLRDLVLAFRALTGPWPTSASATNMFGSWQQFMAAAGGTVVGKGAPGRPKTAHRDLMRAALDRLAA